MTNSQRKAERAAAFYGQGGQSTTTVRGSRASTRHGITRPTARPTARGTR